MPAALYIASIALIAFVLWDVFITIFSADGAGPLTELWTRPLWNGLLLVHRRRPIHWLLSLTGPFILLASIVLWYILLGAGILLAFAAHPDSVINNNTGMQVDLLNKIYFVGSTISSLGYGDLVPSGFPWSLASTLGTLAATVLLTISLSYVLSVLSAAIERRKLAQAIFGMGASVPMVIERARLGKAEESIKTHLLNVSTDIDHQALKHLSYPILKFFHGTRMNLSPARALLLLSDTFFVLRHLPEEHRPPVGVRQLVESSVENYLSLTMRDIISPHREPHPMQLVEAARDSGVADTSGDTFRSSLEAYLPQRRRLLALCREDGWGEDLEPRA